MPKKSAGRKKGVQRSIPRHSIGSKREGGRNHGRFLCFSRSQYLSFGQKCVKILLSSCEKFRVIGFTRTSTGEYVLLDRRDRIQHYAAMALYLAIFLQKTLGTMHLLLYKELRIQSFICINLATIQIAGVLVSLGVIMRPKETIDFLNSWSYVSTTELGGGEEASPRKFDPLHHISTLFKVISIFFAAQGITAGAVLLSLLMSDLPICLFPLAEKLGWIPPGMFSRFTWQLIFTPLEWLTYIPCLSIAGFSSAIMVMGIGALHIYLEPLQAATVSSLRSRRRLERLYVQLELFNRIFQVWIRFYFPPFLLGYACGTIICLFITIRYTELPLIVYILFPYAALTLVIIIFWLSYDMISVGRGSEDILGGLLQQQVPYLETKTRRERVELMKRARAMRPLVFPLGDCEFSLSLPMNTWEEVLNQVVFLLSL